MGFRVTDDGRQEDPQGEGRHVFPQEGAPSGAGGSWGIKGRDGVTAEPEGCHPAGAGTLEGGAGRPPGGGETRGGKGAEGDGHADP